MSEGSKEAGSHGRFGYVSDYDQQRHMARIQFPDKENLVSAWIPVAVPNSKKNRDECHLDIGEHVYCAMMGNGLESGVVLCALFDDKNKPPEGNADIRKTTYDDGTEVLYDRKNKLLKIECQGDIEIHAKGHIIMKSDEDTDISAGKNATLSAGDDALVSAGDDAMLVGGDDAIVSAGDDVSIGSSGGASISSIGPLAYRAPRIDMN